MIQCKLNSSCQTHQISAVQCNINYLKPSCLLISTDRYTLHLQHLLYAGDSGRGDEGGGHKWLFLALPALTWEPALPGYLCIPQEQRMPHSTSWSAGKVAASTRGKHNQAVSRQSHPKQLIN